MNICKPSIISITQINHGKLSFFHRMHNFKKILTWDAKKFGAEVIVDDPRFGDNLKDPSRHPDDCPLATYKWHLGCSCGATMVKEVRAML